MVAAVEVAEAGTVGVSQTQLAVDVITPLNKAKESEGTEVAAGVDNAGGVEGAHDLGACQWMAKVGELMVPLIHAATLYILSCTLGAMV